MCACQGALVVYTVRQKRIAKEHCNAFLVRPKGFAKPRGTGCSNPFFYCPIKSAQNKKSSTP